MSHLREVNEGYIEHARRAIGISYVLILTGIKCFVHAFVPELFVDCVSSKLQEIEIKVNRK